MKLGLRIVSLGSLAIAAAAVAVTSLQPQAHYTPRTQVSQSAQGGAQYLHGLRANQESGEVSQSDITAAIASLEHMPESSLGLNWEERGPDNRGGRTRAIAIDPSNSNNIFIGSVAGGLYHSTNGGLSWNEVNPEQENLAVASITFSKDGDIYYGTGEGMYNTWTTGYGATTSSGFPGAGIFKSTDGGATFTQLSATQNIACVGALVADPSNNNKIYAATNGGLKVTTDGGTTWTNPISGIGSTGTCYDVHMTATGDIYCTLGSRIFQSTDDGATFTEISKSSAGATDLPRSGTRSMIASAPQDGDYVYVVQITTGNALKGVYRSTDGGSTWTTIGTKSTYFDPFCSSQCQGEYDLAVGVDAANKNRVLVGGISVWSWEQGIGWNQVNGFGPFNIHADNHDIVWDPNNSQKVWIVNDGGVYRSTDGGVMWQEMNKNYVTTQFYNIGFGGDRTIVGGTQDNGSWVIDGQGNTANEGRGLGAVDGFSGDGGFSTISWLVPKIYFTEYQNGVMGRSENSGQSFTGFYGSNMGSVQSSWIMPYHLYENSNDPKSTDSVEFAVTEALRSLGFANAGQDTFRSVIVPMQAAAIMDAASFEVKSGQMSVVSDANGNLSGDGTGTFNAATGEFYVDFNTVPVAEIIATVDLSYAAGAELIIGSNTNGLPYKYTSTSALAMGDTIMIQDPVSSLFVFGAVGEVWVTRGALDFSETPEWFKVADVTGTVQSIDVSADGDMIVVGTTAGRVYRITGLSDVRTDATAATSSQIANQFSRRICDVAIDPNDNDRVMFVMGNYGNSNYIYYSSNATAASPTFTVKDGNMGNFPVYAVTFDKGDASNAIIGTEYGVFTTDNINASMPTWGADNNGLARVPTFTVKQYRTERNRTPSDSIYEGDIFAGTFGRGIFHTTTLAQARPVGNDEYTIDLPQNNDIVVYPNPAASYTNVEVDLAAGMYNIALIDLNGRTVYTEAVELTQAGTQSMKVNLSGVANGTYVITVLEAPAYTSRLIVQQ